ncbi:hypothetical protein HDV04_001096 [Boothiomyces sp. JEL0838]|nr:hypothetical protein HDV04_001096 [Boothiomyces sp. JEL0838]
MNFNHPCILENAAEFKSIQTTFETLLKQKERLSAPMRYQIALDISNVMNAVHTNGYLNPDLLPDRIHFDKEGKHGLCIIERNDLIPSLSNITIEPDELFRPPELESGKSYSQASDVYRYGIVLYYIIFSCYPAKLPLGPELNNCPAYLKDLLLKCTSSNPNVRYTFGQIFDILSTNFLEFDTYDVGWAQSCTAAFDNLMNPNRMTVVLPHDKNGTMHKRKHSWDSGIVASPVETSFEYTAGELVFLQIYNISRESAIQENQETMLESTHFAKLFVDRFKPNRKLDIDAITSLFLSWGNHISSGILDTAMFQDFQDITFKTIDNSLLSAIISFLDQFLVEESSGMVAAGLRHFEGAIGKIDYEFAAYWFEEALIKTPDCAEAAICLGLLHLEGLGVSKNPPESVRLLLEAANNGKDVITDLVLAYTNGLGIQKNTDKALWWLMKCVKLNHPPSQYLLGQWYKSGKLVKKDNSKMVKLFRMAAEGGDVQAQYHFAKCLERGDGVKQNFYEAFRWYYTASQQGSLKAINRVGYCFEKGVGVPKDHPRAVVFYREAANKGFAVAQYNLGLCYMQGLGVSKNSALAIEWFQNSASQDIALAHYQLGKCYEDGFGVDKDAHRASLYFKKARQLGFVDQPPSPSKPKNTESQIFNLYS